MNNINRKLDQFFNSNSIEEKERIKSEILSTIQLDIKRIDSMRLGTIEIKLLGHIDAFRLNGINSFQEVIRRDLQNLYGN